MMRKIPVSLSVTLVAVLAVAPAAMAQYPVEGEFDLTWNECYGQPPDQEMPNWIGTVDIDGAVYDILFWNVGSGWPPGHAPVEPFAPFNEVWAVYDGLELVFGGDCAMETLQGDLVLWGHGAGLLDRDTMEYTATGNVVEAFAGFDGLAENGVSMSGSVEAADDGTRTSPGTLQIG
jgi:hypothetical protein